MTNKLLDKVKKTFTKKDSKTTKENKNEKVYVYVENDEKVFKSSKNFLFFALIIISFSVIFYPFITVIAFSILTAYFAFPLFRFFNKKFWELFSLILTWLSIIIIVVVPLYVIWNVTYSQVKSMVNDANVLVEKNSSIFTQLTNTWITEKTDQNKIVSFVYEQLEWNKELLDELTKSFTTIAKNLWQWVLKYWANIAKSIPSIIINLILYFFLSSSLIVSWPKVRNIFKSILPLDSNVFELYMYRIKSMTSWVIKWNFIISLIQSALTTISFIIAWIPYSWIVFIVWFFLYFPMIWSFPLFIPATIYLIIKWQYIMAAFILIFNSIIISNVDNLLRWKFTPKEASIDSSLMILSVLSWVTIFWIMWILYWPIIAVIWLTSIKVYIELNEKK